MDDSQLVDVLTKDVLKRAFNKFGVEGTEDMINNLCKNEAMKECFLRNYKELLKG